MIAPRSLAIATALWFGALVSPGLAQGTVAQREACAPDAIRLCQDAIPDVPKTTSCMKAHLSELSPACRHQFVAAAPASREPTRRMARRDESGRRASASRGAEDGGFELGTPDFDIGAPKLADVDTDSDTPASRAADVRKARRVVRGLCRNAVLDAGTCSLTNTALDLAR